MSEFGMAMRYIALPFLLPSGLCGLSLWLIENTGVQYSYAFGFLWVVAVLGFLAYTFKRIINT